MDKSFFLSKYYLKTTTTTVNKKTAETFEEHLHLRFSNRCKCFLTVSEVHLTVNLIYMPDEEKKKTSK